MEIYAPREAFYFSMDVLGSKRIPTIVNNLDVIFLQWIMTPSFFFLDMFALVIPYLYEV